MGLRDRLSSKRISNVNTDMQELVDKYLYDDVIGGMMRDSSFIDDCVSEISSQGIDSEIESKINELSEIIKRAIEIAEDKYNNY